MDIDFKEELRKRDELLAGYLKQIEIQEEFIQKQKELIEYLEDHISKITDRYIKHPSEVLSVGDIVTCYVDEVFLDKGKVALSLIKNEK